MICLRYGLADLEPKTLEEIGRTLGLTRERVRQIEVHALRRLSKLREMESVAGCRSRKVRRAARADDDFPRGDLMCLAVVSRSRAKPASAATDLPGLRPSSSAT